MNFQNKMTHLLLKHFLIILRSFCLPLQYNNTNNIYNTTSTTTTTTNKIGNHYFGCKNIHF